MTRLASALRLELTLQVRQRFLHAAIFSGLIWLAVLLPMPRGLRPVAEPYILLGDVCIIGFFFVAGTVFFEKQERTLGAVICTPLRFAEYLAAKLAVLLAVSLFVAVVVVATVAHGLAYHLGPMVIGVALGTLLMLSVGFTTSLPFASVGDWFLAATIPLAVMNLPVLYYSGVWPNPVLYLLPMQGPLMLVGAAFDRVMLAPWQAMYAVTYPAACVAGLCWAAKAMFVRYVVAKSGGL